MKRKMKQKMNLSFIIFFLFAFHTKIISQVTSQDLEGSCIKLEKNLGTIQILQQLLVDQTSFTSELDKSKNANKTIYKQTKQPIQCGNLAGCLALDKSFIDATQNLQAQDIETLRSIIQTQVDSLLRIANIHVKIDASLSFLNSTTGPAEEYLSFFDCLQTNYGPIPCITPAQCQQYIPTEYQEEKLESELKDFYQHGIGGSIQSAVWSPDRNYMAIAGNEEQFGGDSTTYSVRVLGFDGSTLSRLPDAVTNPGANFSHGDTIYSVDWSPIKTNNYIAIGGKQGDGNYLLRILEFNQTLSTITTITNIATNISDEIFSVAWSHDGEYLAVTKDLGTSLQALLLYSFNGTSADLVQVYDNFSSDSDDSIFSVSWSPDDKYLVIGGEFDHAPPINVIEFNKSLETLTLVVRYEHGANIYSVDWSITGDYIAISGDIGTGGFNIRVLKFDEQAGTLTALPGSNYIQTSITNVNAISWRPDVKYLAIKDSDTGLNTSIRILKFDGASLTNIPELVLTPEFNVESIKWDIYGQLIAVGGSDESGNSGALAYETCIYIPPN